MAAPALLLRSSFFLHASGLGQGKSEREIDRSAGYETAEVFQLGGNDMVSRHMREAQLV
jgi:hypothetical protein